MSVPTILVVEDEASVRRILEYLMQESGYQVYSAADGQEALDKARQLRPDLILLDVMLPRMDGHQVCREIRKDFKIAHTPIIMLTARSATHDRISGLQQGANDYVAKPWVRAELLTRIQNLLALSRNKQDANPLTGLPGNTAIDEEVTRRLDAGEDFCFLYLDLDNFKGYNDTYGYAKGDDAIKLLAGVLAETVQKYDPGTVFTGHVGGDDFVMVTPEPEGRPIADHIVLEFDERKKTLFREGDLKRGYLSILDRQGMTRKVPLIGLTIALVRKVGGNFSHMGELSDSAFELKKFGKQVSDSIVVEERRNLPEDERPAGEDERSEANLGSGTDGP